MVTGGTYSGHLVILCCFFFVALLHFHDYRKSNYIHCLSSFGHTHSQCTHTLASQEANDFKNAVFNDTVNIVEVEESFDGET